MAEAALAGGDGCAGFWWELLRFEPTRFLKRAFMELMEGGERERGGGRRRGRGWGGEREGRECRRQQRGRAG